MVENNNKVGITMVDRAMKILHYLEKKEGSAGISEIANALSLPKANVYRIMNTLREWRAVELIEESNGYRLGILLIRFGEKARKNIHLVDVCRPLMKMVVKETEESINLGVLHGDQIWMIHSESGQGRIIATKSMSTNPLYCSSMGKVYLAHFSKESLEDYYRNNHLEPRTENTIVTLKGFLKEKEEILKNNIAFDNDEYEIGLSCIGTPIFNKKKEVVACLSVSGPSTRIHLKKDEIIKHLKNATSLLEEYTEYLDIQ